jgi:predicted dehydrogenase
MKANQRREFLKKLGLASAAITVGTREIYSENNKNIEYLNRVEKPLGNSRINIALIGAGGMGNEDANTCLKHDGVEIIAVCDLYKGRLDDAKNKWGNQIITTTNYKEILANKKVDAVIIGTSDHWHKQISVDALKAGKHVYCEKPMVHSIKEGHEVINAWKNSGKIMMVGAQGTSSVGNEMAKELLAQGMIGDLNFAEGFWARHSPIGAWQYQIPGDASEKTVDWKQYVSNTVNRPFDATRFFRWRNYTDYGTGMSGDLFVHLFSSLHFITNSKGPIQIGASGGLRYWKDGREVPDVMIGMFEYPEVKEHPGFNLSLRCNFVDGTSGTTYLRLVGSKGSMDVQWDKIILKRNETDSSDAFAQAKAKEAGLNNSDRKRMQPPKETIYKVEEGYKGAHFDHHGYWLEAIRTGGKVDQDPVFGFRAAAPALLCNDSYYQNKFISWDPVNMKLK